MKRVLTISSRYDIIKNNYDELLKIFERGETKVKHTNKAKSFSLLKIDMETIGILWFRSRDYSRLIADEQSIFDNEVIKVFEFMLDTPNYLEQSKEIVSKFKLDKKGQVYYKYVIGEDLEKNISNLGSHLEIISENMPLCNRVQVDFSFKEISLANKIQVASRLNTLGKKYGIKINSCNFKEFASKNIWVGNDPCLSGYLMQELLDMKMMKVPQNIDVCPCHKNTDIFGCGEMFIEGVDKVRNSDLNRGKLADIKKINNTSENTNKNKMLKKQPKQKISAKKQEEVKNYGDVDIFI